MKLTIPKKNAGIRADGQKAATIRAEAGNLRYEYFLPMNDPETVLLIDSWEDQGAIDLHHASPMMAKIAALREKYDLQRKQFMERKILWGRRIFSQENK